jgi:hypothetical protein
MCRFESCCPDKRKDPGKFPTVAADARGKHGIANHDPETIVGTRGDKASLRLSAFTDRGAVRFTAWRRWQLPLPEPVAAGGR